MNEQKLKDYLNKFSFGLKDKQLTIERHGTYRIEKFNKLLFANTVEIEEHLNELPENIYRAFMNSTDFLKKADLTKPKYIRMLKTLINYITKIKDAEFIKEISDYDFEENLTDTEIRSFSIKFYLLYYDSINAIMKNVLIRLVEEYPKRAVLNKLVTVVQ
jgi:hypothetical protein